MIFVEFRRFFTEETNSVHRFLSTFPFSWLLVNLRAYEAFVLPSCFAEEHPLDIRVRGRKNESRRKTPMISIYLLLDSMGVTISDYELYAF